ncbi:MAG: acetoin utilization protein AcuC [Actinomycetota bacterium]
MSDRVALVVCPEARIYDLGPQHPLKKERVLLTWSLIEACGLDARPNVERLGCRSASDEELLLVHRPGYLQAVRDAGHGVAGDYSEFGFSSEIGDNPIFPHMHEAGALVAGASLSAAESVWRGEVQHAFNAAGGLHHAMPAAASGFCVYDDPAVAIAWLLEQGAERVAYVDIDVHHGDGPEEIFRGDDRVLTVSIHQFGSGFFPGSGGESAGTALNVPLAAGTGDDGWLEAFTERVLPPVRSFRPQILVTQLGSDTHLLDPLAELRLTTAGYRQAYAALHELAHEAAGGRWVATGGGGYEWARVVPRAWTLAFAEMAGVGDELPDAIPAAWVADAEVRRGGTVPATFADDWMA